MIHTAPVLACLLLLSATWLAPISQSTSIEEGYLTAADGTRLFYQKMGSGPALIVPGRLFLFDTVKPLAGGRTLIAYDMRNRGRSDAVDDASRLTIQDDVRDLEAVRRHFKAERFSTIGYSYLGLMVVMYAAEHPGRVERLVQIGPVPRKTGTTYPKELTASDGSSVIDQEELARVRKLRDEGLHEHQPKEYCEREFRLTRVRLVGDPAKAAAVPSPCGMPNEWPVNLARHFQAHFASIKTLDFPLAEVKQVKAPVLTIHGTRDRNAPYGAGREWALTLPNARLITVPGAAHQVWIDGPWIVDAIDTFLRGEWPEQAEIVDTLLKDR